MLLLDKLKCPGLLVEVMYLELACPANVLALALALAGPANVPPLPRVSLLHCSALLSGEFNWVGSTPCTALLLCPCTALCCAAVMSQQCHAGVSLCTLQGLLFPPPCSNKTLLPSTPLPLEFQQNFIRDWVDDHKVQWTQENQYNVHQSNISDGCTRWCYKWTGLDGWISGWINNNNVYAPLNTCTWVEYNTISWIWMKWNTTQHSTQQCVCTVEHVLYQ